MNAILNQRSQDILAANNWNVCQYALLLMMMAQVCDMEAGELLHVVADCHIYDRHIPLIKELIQRKPYPAPVVKLNPEVKDFYQFTTDDLIVRIMRHGRRLRIFRLPFNQTVEQLSGYEQVANADDFIRLT